MVLSILGLKVELFGEVQKTATISSRYFGSKNPINKACLEPWGLVWSGIVVSSAPLCPSSFDEVANQFLRELLDLGRRPRRYSKRYGLVQYTTAGYMVWHNIVQERPGGRFIKRSNMPHKEGHTALGPRAGFEGVGLIPSHSQKAFLAPPTSAPVPARKNSTLKQGLV